jgi:hypothetical protein
MMALDIASEAANDLLLAIATHVEPGTAVGEPFLVAHHRGEVTLLCRSACVGHGQWRRPQATSGAGLSSGNPASRTGQVVAG